MAHDSGLDDETMAGGTPDDGPLPWLTHADSAAFPGAEEWAAGGLTKREHFAALALQGLLVCWVGESINPKPEKAGRLAVEYADALIAALNAPKEK